MAASRLSRQRASDSVYEALRSAILSRSFAPGQRLNVHELAAELGVSLTPVKDALTRLEAEALIEIRPRSGTFVTAMSPDDVAEAFEIRCALECLAAEKALARATAADIAHSAPARRRDRRTAATDEDGRLPTPRATSSSTSASSRSPAAGGCCRCTRASTRTSRSRASICGHGDWKTRLAVGARGAPGDRRRVRARATRRRWWPRCGTTSCAPRNRWCAICDRRRSETASSPACALRSGELRPR